MMMLATQLLHQRSSHGLLLARSIITRTAPKIITGRIADNVSATVRTFASGPPKRAFPQYMMHAPNCVLVMKCIPPVFKYGTSASGDFLTADSKLVGKMFFEFTPRGNKGYVWANTTKFALTVEEVGLLCHQLPQSPVTIARATGNPAIANHDVIKKLSFKPTEVTGTLIVTVDGTRDGVGGFSPNPPYNEDLVSTVIFDEDANSFFLTSATSIPV